MAIYQNLQVWLLLSALTAAPIAAQPNLDWSTVSGQVLDAHGRPVSEATISAFPLDVAISGPMPQGTISDESGRYKLSLPPFTGRTRLSAAKPRDGYPDAQGLLFATGEEKMPIIHLAPRAKLDHVDIVLGPPDGILEGRVFDKATHTPIRNARITLHRGSPESIYSASLPPEGTFVFALPRAPVELSVSAPGYTPWKYSDNKDGGRWLTLSSSDHIQVTVELSRSERDSASPSH